MNQKTEWKAGDVVTAEKLNKNENEIANTGGLSSLPLLEFEIDSNKNITPKFDLEKLANLVPNINDRNTAQIKIIGDSSGFVPTFVGLVIRAKNTYASSGYSYSIDGTFFGSGAFGELEPTSAIVSTNVYAIRYTDGTWSIKSGYKILDSVELI